MKLIIASTLAAGGAFVGGASLPNPGVGECAVADVVERRSEPTVIDPDGTVVGLRLWVAYSYLDNAGNTAARQVDDICALDIDAETAEMLQAAAADLAEGDVYLGAGG